MCCRGQPFALGTRFEHLHQDAQGVSSSWICEHEGPFVGSGMLARLPMQILVLLCHDGKTLHLVQGRSTLHPCQGQPSSVVGPCRTKATKSIRRGTEMNI